MASRDKALRADGLAALCKKLAAYFKKTDVAGDTLVSLAESVDSGFEEAERGIAEAGKTAQADKVTFSDGETFQQKLDEGKLGGNASIKNGETQTNITGLLKGNGTVVGQADADVDYVTPEYINTNCIRAGLNDTDKGIILQSDLGGGTNANNLISGYACVGTLGLITGVILDPFDSKNSLFENSKGFIFVHPDQYELASLALRKPVDTTINSTSDMSMMGFQIKALAAPTADDDAATKQYVDNAVLGASGKSDEVLVDVMLTGDQITEESPLPWLPVVTNIYIAGKLTVGDRVRLTIGKTAKEFTVFCCNDTEHPGNDLVVFGDAYENLFDSAKAVYGFMANTPTTPASTDDGFGNYFSFITSEEAKETFASTWGVPWSKETLTGIRIKLERLARYTLPTASAYILGGVKGPAKTDKETVQVHVDAQGNLWVAPPETHIVDIGAGTFDPTKLDFAQYKQGDVVMVVADSAQVQGVSII